MAVTPDRAVFWYGCNMTRHGEMIRTAARLLEAVGVDTATAGGPSHCCGSPKDANARINEAMARRTIEKFNDTGRDTVITWCPSCHLNMHDSMAPVTPTQFDTVHVSEVLHARLDRLRALLTRPVQARVMLHAHHGFQGRVAVNRLVPEILRRRPGAGAGGGPAGAAGAHVLVAGGGAAGAGGGAAGDARRDARQRAPIRCAPSSIRATARACGWRRHGVRVVNWMHVLAESAGWPAEDGYKALRNAPDPRAALAAGATGGGGRGGVRAADRAGAAQAGADLGSPRVALRGL